MKSWCVFSEVRINLRPVAPTATSTQDSRHLIFSMAVKLPEHTKLRAETNKPEPRTGREAEESRAATTRTAVKHRNTTKHEQASLRALHVTWDLKFQTG